MSVKILLDPLNNLVHLPSSFDNILIEKNCLDKDLSIVILKPAMIIILPETSKHLYYLRAIGLGVNILLKSELKDGFWLVSECNWNPDSEFILQLMAESNLFCFKR